jgi:hypothetical protein
MADVFNGTAGTGSSFNYTEGDARYVNEEDLITALALKANLVAGKVPLSELPDTVLGGLDYQGTWNPSTNSPNLAGLSPSKGDFWRASTSGTTSLGGKNDWGAGDWVVWNGTSWDFVDNSEVGGSVVQATESILGGAEIADSSQATTGTNDTTIMTPLKVRQAGDARYPQKTDTNPYPQYLTTAEGNVLYEPLGGESGGGGGGGSASFASMSKFSA